MTTPDDDFFSLLSVSRMNCSISFQEAVTKSSLFLFSKKGVTFAFLYSSGTFPSGHYLRLWRMASQPHLPASLALMGASHPNGIHPNPTKCLVCSSSFWPDLLLPKVHLFLLQPFRLASGTWDSWKAVLVIKTEAKLAFTNLWKEREKKSVHYRYIVCITDTFLAFHRLYCVLYFLVQRGLIWSNTSELAGGCDTESCKLVSQYNTWSWHQLHLPR